MPDSGTEVIRPATRADIPELTRLFAEVFSEQRPLQLWAWKYFDHPRGAFSMVCDVGGRLVAHCGGTPVLVRDGSREYMALQSVDFMSSRAHAGGIGGGGVFARTVNRFFEEYCGAGKVSMVYGFPGERHRLFGERVLRYRPVEPVGELVLQPRSGARVSASPVDSVKLALLSHDSNDFRAVRDRAYLEWRYVAHPTHQYEMIAAGTLFSGSLTAVIRRVETEILLMELVGNSSLKNVRKLTQKLQRLGLPVRGWASPAHPLTAKLVDGGFELRERDHRLEYRYFIERPDPQPGEFYYSLGDYDVY